MNLADKLERALFELGPLPCSALATLVKRRKADVLDALLSDDRFRRIGGQRRNSRWSLVGLSDATGTNRKPSERRSDGQGNPKAFTLAEFAARIRVDVAVAALFLDGPEGFVDKGIVAVVPGGYVVTLKGWRFIRGITENITEAAA